MIKDLIRLANHLDQKGLQKEADTLDRVIQKVAASESREYWFEPRKPNMPIKPYVRWENFGRTGWRGLVHPTGEFVVLKLLDKGSPATIEPELIGPDRRRRYERIDKPHWAVYVLSTERMMRYDPEAGHDIIWMKLYDSSLTESQVMKEAEKDILGLNGIASHRWHGRWHGKPREFTRDELMNPDPGPYDEYDEDDEDNPIY